MTNATTPTSTGESLSDVVDELFNLARSTVPTEHGMVTIYPCKVKHLGSIMALFGEFLNRIKAEEFDAFLTELGAIQKRAMDEGKSPFDLHEQGAAMLLALLGNRSLIMEVLIGCNATLVPLMTNFVSLPQEKIEDLNLDEFAVVCAGVVAINYGFFTRILRPMLQRAIVAWRSKKNVKNLIAANVAASPPK